MQGPEPTEVPTSLSQLIHNLNQPLSAISTYAHTGKHLIDNGISDHARLKELFAKIAAQCVRATALSHELSKAANTPPASTEAP